MPAGVLRTPKSDGARRVAAHWIRSPHRWSTLPVPRRPSAASAGASSIQGPRPSRAGGWCLVWWCCRFPLGPCALGLLFRRPLRSQLTVDASWRRAVPAALVPNARVAWPWQLWRRWDSCIQQLQVWQVLQRVPRQAGKRQLLVAHGAHTPRGERPLPALQSERQAALATIWLLKRRCQQIRIQAQLLAGRHTCSPAIGAVRGFAHPRPCSPPARRSAAPPRLLRLLRRSRPHVVAKTYSRLMHRHAGRTKATIPGALAYHLHPHTC